MTSTPRPWRRRAAGLRVWLQHLHHDQRGEISQYAVVTAIGVLIALAVLAIIRAVVLDWANSIPTPGP